ncbi:hypothetical protein STCU_01593 [Strigomonas culicis]|uniref:Uncharacterized protein n=2 Tax=Strigomonas culicis TaxID=28005 RepID=S9WFB0_9TRYP|nr:hypothetical protein STCU_07234 [Strigomonas culicis]EPY34420.1 hypothetical protein STCU_01593 [Strigomonas culicis]|eukprot:EPY24330.1 hypothetical protein STCU_07234 [Strigomonas culicis]
MEAPKTLNEYFTSVDDLFRKTFRDDCSLFVAIKTTQYSQLANGGKILFSGRDGNTLLEEGADEEVVLSPPGGNYVRFSPRMFVRRDATTLGKVKLSFGLDVPKVCSLKQNLRVDSAGVASADLHIRDVIEGLLVKGGASVNFIAPASQDVTSFNISYQPADFYGSAGYQRNGLGSNNLAVECGVTFVNFLLGGGFERQQISFLEHENGKEQIDVMYAGVGFTGVNWSVAGKVIRASDVWSTARLSVLQRLSPSTAMACAYNFDIAQSVANVTVGFMQGLRLRLPTLFSSRRADARTPLPTDSLVPLVWACKAESSGVCSTALRGTFSDSLRWSVIVHKNMLVEKSAFQFGVSLSMENDS